MSLYLFFGNGLTLTVHPPFLLSIFIHEVRQHKTLTSNKPVAGVHVLRLPSLNNHEAKESFFIYKLLSLRYYIISTITKTKTTGKVS